jgi:hypothetical protein
MLTRRTVNAIALTLVAGSACAGPSMFVRFDAMDEFDLLHSAFPLQDWISFARAEHQRLLAEHAETVIRGEPRISQESPSGTAALAVEMIPLWDLLATRMSCEHFQVAPSLCRAEEWWPENPRTNGRRLTYRSSVSDHGRTVGIE